MTPLNVVALVSGGKDSFFSILHCQANGHKVVALGNLHPRPHGTEGPVDDLDSFMYQTIGHAIIPLYQDALGLPLYRQEIHGGAAVQDKNYAPAVADDETESLVPLLRRVMAAHPTVNAVSTGAILSDYQRTRVESVALRMGLTPLSYLWQWPKLPPYSQTSLLEDMRAVGQDSRIIKVASGGLDESFLWQNVADSRTIARLTKAVGRFGAVGDGAVLGEGGEFETLTIDGPRSLWKGRISVPAEDIINMPGEAGTFSVRMSKAIVVHKPDGEDPVPHSDVPRIPLLLDQQFQGILEELRDCTIFGAEDPIRAFSNLSALTGDHHPCNSTVSLADCTGEGDDASEQTRTIMDRIVAVLGRAQRTPGDIACTIIVLRDMANFAAVNTVYGSYFTKPDPPARITIACGDVLPVDCLVSVSVTWRVGRREGLHVQSQSYWAPANIGPYSQAIKVSSKHDETAKEDTVFYVAGQIPLIPASMQLPPTPCFAHPHAGFLQQIVLSLQHLDRIGKVIQVQQWDFAIAFIASSAVEEKIVQERAGIARHTWRTYHQTPSVGRQPSHGADEADGFDVWDVQHGLARSAWRRCMPSPDDPDVALVGPYVPPLVVITADALPMEADIEWVGYGKGSLERSTSIPEHLRDLLKAFGHRVVTAPAAEQ